MIIIKSIGGLGNQLFQYALYKRFLSLGREAKIDFSQLYRDGLSNELNIFDNNFKDILNLGEAFDLLIEDNKDILEEVQEEIHFTYGRLEKMFRRKAGIRKKNHIIEKASYTYDPDILKLDNAYLFGYWQSQKYFLPIREELLEDIKFPEFTEVHNLRYAAKINECECPVSLHIRRGDYLIKKFRKQYGGICTDTYITEAINYFKQSSPKAHFFVFTNDKEWVNGHFSDIKMTIVLGNSGTSSYRDLQLMSMCKHNIIANSSFSWWGAWLNSTPDKQVIMPPMWNRTKPTPDIWVPEWIRLNTPVEDL